ncbi:MAG: DUF4129 domain-containing protein [Acidimicrobiia bacterium]|nr:DUF4129 domain-containing protein [Acidimicrobiia bacterium]
MRHQARHRLARCALGAALVAAIATGAVGPGHIATADDVASSELEALVAAAPTDRDALERLRQVTSVDGHPADLSAIAEGFEGDALAARLEALSAELAPADGSPAGPPVVADDARARAEDVLDDRDFRASRLPNPLRGAIEWLADRLEPLGRPIAWLWRSGAGRIGLIAVVLTAAAVLASQVGRARLRAPTERRRGHRAEPRPVDPAGLERDAEEAERAGDLDRAVRLRFVAGLLRLERQGRVHHASAAPNHALGDELSSADFDALALAFDEIAYGGRPATAADVDDARSRWTRVVKAGDR